MTEEVWLAIPGYEGKYEASDQGRVRSVERRVRLVVREVETTRRVPPRVLKPGWCRSGHVSVALGKNNSKMVHVLIARTFLGPRPEDYEVLHKNETPHDNRLVNLKYGTKSENLKMDYASGVRKTHPNFNRWGYRYD